MRSTRQQCPLCDAVRETHLEMARHYVMRHAEPRYDHALRVRSIACLCGVEIEESDKVRIMGSTTRHGYRLVELLAEHISDTGLEGHALLGLLSQG